MAGRDMGIDQFWIYGRSDMKVVNVNLVISEDGVLLVINDNIKFEGDSIAVDALFNYIQQEAQGTVNLNLSTEFTPDIKEWQKSNLDTALLSQGEVEIFDVGEVERDS